MSTLRKSTRNTQWTRCPRQSRDSIISWTFCSRRTPNSNLISKKAIRKQWQPRTWWTSRRFWRKTKKNTNTFKKEKSRTSQKYSNWRINTRKCCRNTRVNTMQGILTTRTCRQSWKGSNRDSECCSMKTTNLKAKTINSLNSNLPSNRTRGCSSRQLNS